MDRYATVTDRANAHGDIGYISEAIANRREHSRKGAAIQHQRHSWKLVAQQHGQSKHRCHCGTTRTLTQSDGITSTRYTLGNKHFDKAPPCQSVHVEQIP